ncbi:glycoside hydrolase family 18 protein [Dendrothele bispora CBS 962.96]|uniref:Glycoside hydrolase family 18 protein n=1 Tax=Dendrothele bispora (strain CBS 962.96) TaxID=1314807 RepID=A0A4S8MYB0_DENBC|nr:glycoside hydrolase family 18 protein [Dendrothele bispora CBS 962.96]
MLSILSFSLYFALLSNGLSFTHAVSPKIAVAYFAGWHSTNSTPTFSVSDVSWEKYTKLTYAFAVTTEDPGQLSLEGSAGENLPSFVEEAHKHNVSAAISIGGWSGSRFWSTAVGSSKNRTIFVKTITDFVTRYGLDAVDFDWEYPNRQGLGCNTINDNDTANFLEFLKELRLDPVGSQLMLSAAVSITPFSGPDGNPSSDVSEFAKYLNYITLMNYDIWGSWSSAVGPNAPLNDTCAAPANQQGSAVFAVKRWNDAGFPLDQIVLAVATYGHSFSVKKSDAFVNGSSTELAAYPPFNASAFPLGDSWDTSAGTVDFCGVAQNNGGNWDFWAVVEAGLYDQNGKPAQGVPYRFDDCSKTPYVYLEDREIMISFDDPESWAAKGEFISDMGLAGFAIWEAGGDYNDLMLDAIRGTAGFEDN